MFPKPAQYTTKAELSYGGKQPRLIQLPATLISSVYRLMQAPQGASTATTAGFPTEPNASTWVILRGIWLEAKTDRNAAETNERHGYGRKRTTSTTGDVTSQAQKL